MALGGMTTTLVRATAITVTGVLHLRRAAPAHELVAARGRVPADAGAPCTAWG